MGKYSCLLMCLLLYFFSGFTDSCVLQPVHAMQAGAGVSDIPIRIVCCFTSFSGT